MAGAVLGVLLLPGLLLGVGPPYEAIPVPATELSGSTVVKGFVSADFDGDGRDEWATGVTTGVLFRAWRDGTCRAAHQTNLPPRFLAEGCRVLLGPAHDWDGDGRRELLVTARNADGRAQQLLAVAPGRADPLLACDLPAGPDLRADGRWDGEHAVIGVIETGDGPLAILERRVQYDRATRAVVAWNLRAGREAWRFPTAGNPHHGVVADLDGDGLAEIVVGVGSPENLKPGEEVRGRRDDEAWILALGAAGDLRWEQRVAGRFADPDLAVADLDGDGVAEVAASSNGYGEGTVNRLWVLAGDDGRVRDAVEVAAPGRGLLAWRDEEAGAGAVICVLDDGRIERYAWRDGRLRLVRRRTLAAPIGGMTGLDFLPEAGPEFVAFRADGRMELLAADLQVLATLPRPAAARVEAGGGIWDLGPGSLLAVPNATGVALRLAPAPIHRRFAGPAGAGLVLVAAAGIGGTLVRQRRRLRRLRRTSRRDLLRAFLTSRHGTVGPVGALERVMWAVENPGPGPGERLAATWQECRREAVPDLEALLEKAAHIRLDPPLLSIVRRELAALGRALDELAAAPADERRRAGLVAAARTSLGLVADGVKSLGSTLADSCRLDPLPMVRELVQRHAGRRPEVGFALDGTLWMAGWPVHADARHLEFALDNLLDNAARHAAAGPDPRVTVTVAVRSDRMTVTVADNGAGVPDADRERIFAPGVSSKTGGGGLGLWHSREALRYYGGDLVLEPATDGGARFAIILRTAFG